MSIVVWKAVVVISIAVCALFVFELALMWSLMRGEGVQQVLDRRFEGGFDTVRELAVLAISTVWINSKITRRKDNEEYRRARVECPKLVDIGGPRAEEPDVLQSSYIDGDDLFEYACVDGSDAVFRLGSFNDSDSSGPLSETNFIDPIDDSTNPANGLPMVGVTCPQLSNPI